MRKDRIKEIIGPQPWAETLLAAIHILPITQQRQYPESSLIHVNASGLYATCVTHRLLHGAQPIREPGPATSKAVVKADGNAVG